MARTSRRARPAGPERGLGGVEAGMAIGDRAWPLNMVTVVRLSTTPDLDALRRALDEVQRRHPPLRARIEHHRRPRFVYDVDRPIPLHTVARHDADTWTTAVEESLNTRMPGDGPLASATLVGDGAGDRSELILAYQHTIVDGTSAAALWSELLAVYADAAAGGTAPGPSTGVPRAADELVPARHRGRRLAIPRLRFVGRSIADEVRYRRSTVRRAPRVVGSSRTQVHTYTFDEDTTRRIGRAARNHHCTVHSLLHAVVMMAVQRMRYDGAGLRMRTIAFADLRPHLEPRPAALDLAPYIALTSQDVSVTPGEGAWELALDVQQRLRESVKGQAKFVSYSMARPLMRMATATARLRMATTAVSHTGPVRIDGADGPLRVEHLHAFVSNLAIGPEISLRTGSFRDRLTLDVMTLDSDMDRDEMRSLATSIVERLDDLAGGG